MTESDRAAALEAELDALYGAALAEFVERRDALAKRLKARGDAEEARRIKALRKPTAVAWAINRLHLESAGPGRSRPGGRAQSGEPGAGLAPLLEASAALRGVLREARSAQERRAAIDARRRALESVTSAVVALLEQAGTTVAPALQRRIEGTLLALAAAAGGPDAPAPGRLDQELEPPGFEAIQDFAASSLPPAAAAGRPAAKEAAPRVSSSRAGASAPATEPPGSARRPSSPSPSSQSSQMARKGSAPAGPTRTPKTSCAATSGAAASAAQRPYVPTRDSKREAAVAAAQRAVDDSETALERATTKAEGTRARADEAEKTLERARREVEAARRELVAARAALSERRRELDRARRT